MSFGGNKFVIPKNWKHLILQLNIQYVTKSTFMAMTSFYNLSHEQIGTATYFVYGQKFSAIQTVM
jgi:hypothetical protein